mgnify:CR=1 FL=1
MKNNLFLGISTSLFLFAANSLNARGNLAYQSTFNKNEIQNLIINLSSEDLIIENTMNEENFIEKSFISWIPTFFKKLSVELGLNLLISFVFSLP